MTESNEVKDPLIFAPKTYQYDKATLGEKEIEESPIKQFHIWFSEAVEACKGECIIPEACTFSTARLPSGRVSSRTVLFKELDDTGFIVYSNWDQSKKAKDFESNNYGALNFFWPNLQRQVRVEGMMEKVSRETSERYFKTRPRGSKIGAWASPQSQKLVNRDQLDISTQKYTEQFKGLDDDQIPCPPFWGGVRIVPLEVEFWQGGMSRLHDRISYVRNDIQAEWEIIRLAP